MIYNNSLNSIFQELGLTEYSEALDTYVTETILRPNELNINTISLDFIRNHQVSFKNILENLDSTEITSDLEQLFLTLFSKHNETVNRAIMLSSKTNFLQKIVGTLIYGLILEIKDLPQVKAKDYDFNIN